MPITTNYEKYEVVAGGGTKNFDSSLPTQTYIIWSAGGVALVAPVTITDDGSSTEGMEYPVLFTGGVTLNAQTLTIFGYSLNASQATNGCKLLAYYDGSGFVTYVDANLNGTAQIQTADIADEAVTFGKMADLARGSLIVGGASNRPIALNAKTNLQILIGDGTDLKSVAQSGDGSYGNTGVFGITAGVIVNADIAAAAGIAVVKLEAMTDGQIITGNTGAGNQAQIKTMSSDAAIANTGAVTIQANSITPSKATTGLSYDEINVDVSFAAASNTGKFTTIMPTNYTLLNTYGIVTSVIGAVDSGTITPDIAGVPVTGGVITFAASDPLNTEVSGTAITANNTGSAGDKVNLVVAKATAGGTVRVTVRYQKTN